MTEHKTCENCKEPSYNCGCPKCYRVVRFYRDRYPNRRIIERGLSLVQAQEHCGNPETSSSTCTSSAGKRRTRQLGPWFDGYEMAR